MANDRETKRRINFLLIILAVIVALIPFTAAGIWYWKNGILTQETILGSAFSVCGSISASLFAMVILRFFLNKDMVELEEKFIGFVKVMSNLGIEDIARRGGDDSLSRNTLPNQMILSAKAEFLIVAFSAKDTLLKYEKKLMKKLKSNPNFRLGCLLLHPDTDTAIKWKIKDPKDPERTVQTDIRESIKCLERLRNIAKDRVELRTYKELPTLTATAFDAEILTEISVEGGGLIGIQPRLEGQIKNGLILDIGKKEGGVWVSIRKSIAYYWRNGSRYGL